jgi:hypothetical protein
MTISTEIFQMPGPGGRVKSNDYVNVFPGRHTSRWVHNYQPILIDIRMANPKQLAKLKEGVEGWNKWRKSNPSIEADLREADLNEANLRKATLWLANCYGRADFTGAAQVNCLSLSERIRWQ